MSVVPESAPALPAAPSAIAPLREVDYRFEFNGDAKEYFRIWIVNLALSIVTLGIYSAWSKVRTQRYFYANTRVAGAPFEYLGQPIPILKGRILAFVVFGSYVISGGVSIKLQIGLAALIGLLTPWLIVRGLRFRARYSAWRAITFRFAGTYGDAYVKYLLMFLLVPLTLGIFYPFLRAHQKRYLVEGLRFGAQPFTFTALNGEFFPPYLAAFGMLIGWYILTMMLFFIFFSTFLATAARHSHAAHWPMFVMIGFLYFGMFMIFVYVATRIGNLVYNSMEFAGNRLHSNLEAMKLIGLYLSNAFAILLSAGMLIPWAMVRLAKYRASCLVLMSARNLDCFTAAPTREEGAAGAELDSVFDIDVGF
jgi:uncharacterized membrane protein YjgN (DUF898 family)